MSDFSAQVLLDFWFDEKSKPFWFQQNTTFDAEVKKRFLFAYYKVKKAGENWVASSSPRHALAEILLLDQIPRNIFRKDVRAYATDALARHKANLALSLGFHEKLNNEEQRFMYMPFMHSEQRDDQSRSVQLFSTLDPVSYDFARRHQAIIERFGRFPHRNKLLGRKSTPEEIFFLKDAAAGF